MPVDPAIMSELYNKLGVSSREATSTPTPMPEEIIPTPEDPSLAAQAYGEFEKLPLLQQLGLAVAPGTGHAIAAYETPMFAKETREAVEEGNIPRVLGQGALTGLSALGMIPGLGLGIRGVKAGVKGITKALRATAKEDQFWKETLTNPASKSELLEAAPSFSYKDGIIDIATKDQNQFFKYLDDLNLASKGEDWSMPPRLRGYPTVGGTKKLEQELWDRAVAREVDPSYYIVKGDARKILELDDDAIKIMREDAEKRLVNRGPFDKKNPIIEKSIRDVANPKNPRTIQDHIRLLDGDDITEGLKPVRRYAGRSDYGPDDMPISATNEEIAMAIGPKLIARGGIIDVNAPIKTGTDVSSRLNINAYENYDTWVASVKVGTEPMKYGATARLSGTLENPVKFGWEKNIKELAKQEDKALKVGVGETRKSPFATINGKWVEHNSSELIDEAKKYIDDPEWVQVGFDPRRHSRFYTREDFINKAGEVIAGKHSPIESATEVIQIGPLVLAKNPVFGKSMRYKQGGSIVERNPHTYNMRAI
jgi:hypothetical protein